VHWQCANLPEAFGKLREPTTTIVDQVVKTYSHALAASTTVVTRPEIHISIRTGRNHLTKVDTQYKIDEASKNTAKVVKNA